MCTSVNVTVTAAVFALLGTTCGNRAPDESIVGRSLCRIVRGTHVLADVQINEVGPMVRVDSLGLEPQNSYFTTVAVQIKEVLWGDLEVTTHSILVQGEIDATGWSVRVNGTYLKDEQPTSGLMFIKKMDGKLFQANQGYFWISGDVYRNDATYRYGIAREELVDSESLSGPQVVCPDDDNPDRPRGDARQGLDAFPHE